MATKKSVQSVLWGDAFGQLLHATMLTLRKDTPLSAEERGYLQALDDFKRTYHKAVAQATQLRAAGQLAKARAVLAGCKPPQRPRTNGSNVNARVVMRALQVALIDEAMRSLTQQQLIAVQGRVINNLQASHRKRTKKVAIAAPIAA